MNVIDIPALYEIYRKYPVICTDTRKITTDCLFFALSGTQFDGNKFAPEALSKEAAYAVVSDPSLTGHRYIQVEDTLAALQSLALYHRRHFQNPFIAITGTNGKTTTKELVTTVLSRKYKVHATAGNLNNHIGVPLTLLSMPLDTEMAVIEMGANHIGEIKRLCEIAMPTHGIITNIGKAHLEGFGSVEGIQKAKGELFEYLKATNGHAFVNSDDMRVLEIAENMINKTNYGFAIANNPALNFSYHTLASKSGFTINDERNQIQITSAMFGQYNAMNMLAAYNIGLHFEVPPTVMAEALSTFVSGANRSEVINYQNCTVIKDAYNANPSSMELAIRDFAKQYPEGTVILGDMKELGDTSLEAHRHIIQLLQSCGVKKVYLVGEMFQQAHSQFSTPIAVNTVGTIEELIPHWTWEMCNGSTVLLKGSRSMRLEKILEG